MKQDDGRKSGGCDANSKKGFKTNEHACFVEEVFVVSDSSIFQGGRPDSKNSKLV